MSSFLSLVFQRVSGILGLGVGSGAVDRVANEQNGLGSPYWEATQPVPFL